MLEDGLRDITAGGISDFSTAVSVHAAAGITFDLRALRDRFGPDAVHTFSAFIGASPCDCGPAIIRQYVIFSNEDEILEDENAEEEPYWSRLFETSQGEQYEGEIPPDAAYLTLATGSAGFDICCDHGVFADAQILPCPAADCPSAGQSAFRRGDVDGNGALEVTDPIANLSFQFLGTFEPTCLDALDWDDSGTIEITDPISSLTRQFLGGTPAAAPGSEACGADPSADELDCVASPTCE
jgi:hypothetical protein